MTSKYYFLVKECNHGILIAGQAHTHTCLSWCGDPIVTLCDLTNSIEPSTEVKYQFFYDVQHVIIWDNAGFKG